MGRKANILSYPCDCLKLHIGLFCYYRCTDSTQNSIKHAVDLQPLSNLNPFSALNSAGMHQGLSDLLDLMHALCI